jgi:hypothetical protein
LYGGILKKDVDNVVEDVRIVPSFESKFSLYQKLIGVMTFGTNELNTYINLLNASILKGINQYYLAPWIENLASLPCLGIDLVKFKVESVNSKSEYEKLVEELKSTHGQVEITLVEIEKLKPIEDFIKERAVQLYDTISKSEFWIKPIVIEKNHSLILDGHHRFDVAKRMGIKLVPAVIVNYSEIEIWSLRADEEVTHDLVVSRALSNSIYPNKTVKHNFPFKVPECQIPIKNLV